MISTVESDIPRLPICYSESVLMVLKELDFFRILLRDYTPTRRTPNNEEEITLLLKSLFQNWANSANPVRQDVEELCRLFITGRHLTRQRKQTFQIRNRN